MEAVAQTYPEHGKAIFALGVPLIASNLANFAIHMTDTLMLGQYSVSALAAAVIATTMFFVVFIVGSGFAMAVTPLVATAAEEGDDVRVRRVTRMGLWLSVIYGVIVMIPFFWAEPILLAIGQEPQVAASAQIYLQIAIFGMVPGLVAMTLKSFMAGLEHTGIILWATILTGVLNAIINYALIFGNLGAPELGLQGAAIASVIAQVVTVVILVGYTMRQLPQFELFKNLQRSDNEILSRVFKLGLPIGIAYLAEGGLFSASAVMIGWIGEIPLAAHGIAIQLASASFMIHIGLSQAATIRAGRALGRKDEVALRRGGIVVTAFSLAFACMTMLLFFFGAAPLISVFLSADDPVRDDVLRIGIVLVAVAGLFQVVDAAQVMALGLLRGVQDTAIPMVIATFSYWGVGMPASYLLAFTFGFGPEGVWFGLVIGLSVAAVLLMWRFWKRPAWIET